MTATGLSNNYYLDNEFKKWFVLDVIHNFKEGFKKGCQSRGDPTKGLHERTKLYCVFWHSLSNLMDNLDNMQKE